jgi:hypothetical protein
MNCKSRGLPYHGRLAFKWSDYQQLAVQFLPWLARNDLLFGWLVVAAGVDLL